ncbi:hypothetical protein C0993_007128 [Termitomyces sp. T159_Od127]|nr:hypothetical protein C0993_007128 [Termitomyces sp. T159_Od127]
MKISSSNSLFHRGITTLKNWQEKIEPSWINSYEEALRRRQHTLLQHLLDLGRPLSVQSELELEILLFFARLRDAEDIHNLVDQGMNLTLCDKSNPGWTALPEAACHGNLDTVTALSQQEPGLMSQASDYQSQKPRTALEFAIISCKPDVVANFLERGAQAPPSAFHDAVRLNCPIDECLEIVQLLLDHGWDRTAKDENGKRPIDYVHDRPDWSDLNKSAIIECLENYQTVSSEPTAVPTSEEGEE